MGWGGVGAFLFGGVFYGEIKKRRQAASKQWIDPAGKIPKKYPLGMRMVEVS